MKVEKLLLKAFNWYYEERMWNTNISNEEALELFKETDAYQDFYNKSSDDADVGEGQSNIPDIKNSCEQPQDNSDGDLVPLVWFIEKLRRREGGCTINELVAEAKRNFRGIEQIKHRTINYH